MIRERKDLRKLSQEKISAIRKEGDDWESVTVGVSALVRIADSVERLERSLRINSILLLVAYTGLIAFAYGWYAATH